MTLSANRGLSLLYNNGNAGLTASSTTGLTVAQPSPPVNTVLPVISGTETEGETLSTTNGTWTGKATITFTYQWERSGTPIGGATNNTYLLVADDVGETITVVVTGTNGDGASSAESLPTGEIQPAGGGLPTHSIDFESGSNQSLSMSDANFGAYDHAKFAISVWVKRESTSGSADFTIMRQFGADRAFAIAFENDKLAFYTYKSDGNLEGGLNTTATYTSTAAYYHILAWYDSANATADNRMRIWVDGAEVVSFSFRTNPTAAANDAAADINISSTTTSADFDGLVYQLGFFSGTNPAIGDVYDAGSPVDISGLAGLHSYLDCLGGDVTSDGILATNWTNNNTVTASTDIPT